MPNTFFQRGEKKFSVCFAPLVAGLIKTNKFSFSEILRREHICDHLRKSCTAVSTVTSSNESSWKLLPPPKWRAGCNPAERWCVLILVASVQEFWFASVSVSNAPAEAWLPPRPNARSMYASVATSGGLTSDLMFSEKLLMFDVSATNLMLTELLFLFFTFPLILGCKSVRSMIVKVLSSISHPHVCLVMVPNCRAVILKLFKLAGH